MSLLDHKFFDDVCVDCKSTDHATYYVLDKTWKEAGLGRLKVGQGCCLSCLMNRLGRRLQSSDFNFRSPSNLFAPCLEFSPAILRRILANIGLPKSLANAIRSTRRKYPQGLTHRQVCGWMEQEAGIPLENFYAKTMQKGRSLKLQ